MQVQEQIWERSRTTSLQYYLADVNMPHLKPLHLKEQILDRSIKLCECSNLNDPKNTKKQQSGRAGGGVDTKNIDVEISRENAWSVTWILPVPFEDKVGRKNAGATVIPDKKTSWV